MTAKGYAIIFLGVLTFTTGCWSTSAKPDGPATWSYVAPPQDSFAQPTVPSVPSDTFSGQIQDRYGNPVEGAFVNVWSWHNGSSCRTDADGKFTVPDLGLDQKTIEVRFTKPGFSPVHMFRQTVGRLKRPLVMGNSTYFEGRVTDTDGNPVSNVIIRADAGPRQAEGVAISETVFQTKSEQDGHYRLYVQHQSYRLAASAPQGVAKIDKVDIGKDERKELDIQLAKGATFVAKVFDSQTKQPVSGITLRNWKRKEVKGVSDEQGIVRIDGLQIGPFEFSVKAQEQGYMRWWSDQAAHQHQRFHIKDRHRKWQRNFDHLEFNVQTGMDPVSIILEKGVRIRGIVVSPDGATISDATVAPAMTGTGNSITGDTRFSVVSKEDGRFEMILPASKSCEYNLVVHDGKYKEWRMWANGTAAPITTQPGGELDDVVMRLSTPCIVRGSVIDQAGEPVRKREVRATTFAKTDNRYYVPTCRTDDNGDFELKFVSPGKSYVQVAPFWLDPAHAPAGTSQVVEADPESPVANVRLRAAQN